MLIWLIVCSLLHKTPLIQPQPAALSWAAQRRRPHVHSPSRSTVTKTPLIWTTVQVRLSTWRHVPSHASARAIPRLARVLRNTFRNSVTSHSGFPQGLLTNLWQPGSQFSLPASWLVPFEASAHSDVTHVIRLPCCVGVSSRYLLAACDLLRDIYSRPVQKWCVYVVTVHVCAVKRLHTRYLGLKINNFVTQSEIWGSWVVVVSICGTVDLLVFKVIWGHSVYLSQNGL